MYPTVALLGLMFLTWGVAMWASWRDKEHASSPYADEREAEPYEKAA